ncbi:MAG: hypothetical protein LVR00_05950 [Rhabdochlamydiaceae bacterium]|jgi:insulysin
MHSIAVTLTDYLKQLKKENLGDKVSVSSSQFSQDEALFEISISLTEKGVKNINTVIDRCFQAINCLKMKGIPDYLFQENKQMSLINYEYQTRADCFSFVENLGSNIIYEPLETFPQKLNIPTMYDPAFLQDFIHTLVPQTCAFFVQADPKLTGIKMTSKERWMGAEYTIEPISQEQLTTWKNISVNPNLQLPPRNPFIPTNLALLPTPSDKNASPELLAKDEGCAIYFKQDSRYKVPTATSIFSIKTPLLDGSPHSTVLFDLYLYSLKEQLYSPLSFASTGGLDFGSLQQDLKIVFMVSGYSDKQPTFLKTIFQALPNVRPTQEEFDSYKEFLATLYQNASKEIPIRQGIEILQSVLSNNAPTSQARYAALNQISYKLFLQFCENAFKKAYIEGMIYGNFSQASAKKLWNSLKVSLGPTPYPLNTHLKKKSLSYQKVVDLSLSPSIQNGKAMG